MFRFCSRNVAVVAICLSRAYAVCHLTAVFDQARARARAAMWYAPGRESTWQLELGNSLARPLVESFVLARGRVAIAESPLPLAT